MFKTLFAKKSGVVLERTSPQGAVEEMAARAQKPAADPSELAKCKGREVHLRAVCERMLGIEAQAKAEVKKELTAIQKRILQLETIPKVMGATGAKYQIIDLTPLTFRHKNGDPKLAVFGLESGLFQLVCTVKAFDYKTDHHKWWRNTSHENRMEPNISDEVLACYSDIFEALKARGEKELPWFAAIKSHWDDFSITAHFKGMIPDEVKTEIQAAQKSGVFQKIFLVAEAAEVTHSKDPLVIGFDGANHWLIRKFNTTSLEEMMATEFAVKP